MRLKLSHAICIVSLIAFPVGVLAQAESGVVISQKKRTYAPGKVTIRAGETIKIINDDIFLHHAFVDSDEMDFDSGSMEEGETRTVQFNKRGKFQVKCAIHPKMNLDVTVE